LLYHQLCRIRNHIQGQGPFDLKVMNFFFSEELEWV